MTEPAGSTSGPPSPAAPSAASSASSSSAAPALPAPSSSIPASPSAGSPGPPGSSGPATSRWFPPAGDLPAPTGAPAAGPAPPSASNPVASGAEPRAGQTAPPIAPPSTPGAGPPSVPNTGWSPLGATPTSPPPLTGAPGADRYLPPVAPPTDPISPTPPAPAARSRWGWRALVAFLAGGLIAAAGFGAAQVTLDEDDETATTAVPTRTTTPSSTSQPPVRGTAPVPEAEPPADVEPAAYVAQILGPAVVQLETGFGLGSGVIYDDNLILTNFHVIEGATNVTVTLSTGRVLPGRVIGTDPSTDVAVVEVDTEEPLPKAELATGVKPQVGQLAIAIGSPFDLQQSVTQGIVSAVDRPVPNTETSVVAMIQTDAPINPGNSGGALADRFGRVIGINTSIQTDGFTSTNVGVGFAIPIDTAVRIADLLAAGQPIEPGFLGVRGEEPPNGEVGVLLTEITEESAAEAAGLLVGDRVLSLNGAPVTEMLELAGLVVANQAGDSITLEVVRDGELIEVEAVLGLRDPDN